MKVCLSGEKDNLDGIDILDVEDSLPFHNPRKKPTEVILICKIGKTLVTWTQFKDNIHL